MHKPLLPYSGGWRYVLLSNSVTDFWYLWQVVTDLVFENILVSLSSHGFLFSCVLTTALEFCDLGLCGLTKLPGYERTKPSVNATKCNLRVIVYFFKYC